MRIQDTKILVVNPLRLVYELTAIALAKQGYFPDIQWVQDGGSGITTAKSYNPNLIIIDENLPDMPGPDVCGKLREGNPNTGIVGLLGLNSTATIPFYDAGADLCTARGNIYFGSYLHDVANRVKNQKTN